MKAIRRCLIALAALAALAFPAYGLAQSLSYAPGDVAHILGSSPLFSSGLRTSELDQSVAGAFAKRAPLVAGVYTYTFAAGEYASPPVCTGSEEAVTGHYVKITAISAAAVTFTSDVTTSNVDNVDLVCFGNPT